MFSTIESCTRTILEMSENKIYLPDAAINFVIDKLITARHYDQSLAILNKLCDHGKIEKLNHKDILKNYLFYDQSDFAFQFLQLLPLGVFLYFILKNN